MPELHVEYTGPFTVTERSDTDGCLVVVSRISHSQKWSMNRHIPDENEGAIDHRRVAIDNAKATFERGMIRSDGRFPHLPVRPEDMDAILNWLSQYRLPCVAMPDRMECSRTLIDTERRIIMHVDCPPETGRLLASILNALPVLLLARE